MTQRIEDIKHAYLYDIFIPTMNLVIECYGDYWHTLKYHVYRDEKRDIFLTNKGYKILRIKEKEYNLNKQIVVNTCLQFIKENYERPHPKS